MADKIWGRVVAGVIAEILPLPESLVPGRDVFHADWVFVDVTATPGASVGWGVQDGIAHPPATPVPSAAALKAAAKAARDARVLGGKTVNVAVTGQPDKMVFAKTDSASAADLIGACDLAQATAATTFWDVQGVITPLSPAEMVNLKLGVLGYLQRVRQAYALVRAEIAATPPAITTPAQIDAFAWPAAG